MNISSKILLILLVMILFAGWFLFSLSNNKELTSNGEDTFQTWLWENRGMDLTVQVLLVFSGALGIAAILPDEDE